MNVEEDQKEIGRAASVLAKGMRRNDRILDHLF
jgi:hypothetical protein